MISFQNFNVWGIVLEDYLLKCCALKEDTKINISGFRQNVFGRSNLEAYTYECSVKGSSAF